MATQRRNLFLYLTLACFLGLIAIFIFDGYMGIYDTVYITSGEQERRIDSDVWQRGQEFWSSGVSRGEKAFFRYEVDNRRFPSYAVDIEVSVWRSQEKLRDIISQRMTVGPFDKGQLEWMIDTAEFLPADLPPEQSYEFTVMIRQGEIRRNVILYVNPSPFPIKPVPVVPR